MMNHLPYQPLLPARNKYLQQKWDKASYDLHRKKVKSAKPTIDTTAPKTYGHLTLKLKKKKLEEEWTMRIQRENNILTEKISNIMKTTGSTDNRNYYDRKSLGNEQRQLELLRITKENEMILLRLSQSRPHYNVRSWHEDWIKTLKVMDSIAHYPRGRSNQQKRQEKPSKKYCVSNKEQKITVDETHSATRHKTKAESEDTERKKETSNKEDTGKGTHEVMPTDSKANVPEKSILPDTPAERSASDTIKITPTKQHC